MLWKLCKERRAAEGLTEQIWQSKGRNKQDFSKVKDITCIHFYKGKLEAKDFFQIQTKIRVRNGQLKT